MLDTLKELSTGLTTNRWQVWNLAKLTLRKETRATALGFVWLFVKPAMYIFCFWFALRVGLKSAESTMDGAAYLVWLSAGIIPWFFLQKMLGTGSKIFNKYAYLVNKLKFPVTLIPVFYSLSFMILHLIFLVCLGIGYFAAGGTLDIHILQIPIMLILMYLMFTGWSFLTSTISAFSKDFVKLIAALSTPIFWLSGVLFDVSTVNSALVQAVLKFNPVTFLVTGYRQVFTVTGGTKVWLWSDPTFCILGVGIILLTFILGIAIFAHFRKELADVL